ncbi:MAG TPA: 16S rRNA (guanine(527)-N(7))-methyltransferase RsmG [Trueperaceae bacterium]|nr:16S rRNA (guanine(527)-N(7))-methyltransferase RsmG [Trueperaceae bacterium]
MFHVKQNNKILAYKKLLEKYHNTLDLISTKALKNIDQKISDALEYAKAIEKYQPENKNLLDIGSGNGLPAIIIAISLPHWNVNLVERRSRRASFLKIVSSQLGLTNTKVYMSDVNEIRLEPQAVISAQAVGQFKDLYCLSNHLHSNKILLLSRKGQTWQDELIDLETALNTKIEAQKPIELSQHGNLIGLSLLGGIECQ